MHRPRPLPLLVIAFTCLVAGAVACTPADSTGGRADASGRASTEATPPEGPPTVDDATIDWPANPSTALVRFHLRNGGPADTVVGVASPVGKATIHRSEIGEDGAGTMVPQDEVDVPARSTVEFAPGGLHVMLTGITADLQVGDTVPVTVTLEDAGDVRFEATVVEPGSVTDDDEGADHEHGS